MKKLVYVSILLATLSGCASQAPKQAKIDRITPEQLAKLMPPAIANVSLDEIVADSKAGKNADEIIAKIKASNSRYELTPQQVVDLNKQGVDVKVLDYIAQSNELAKQNAIADEMNKREKNKNAQIKQARRQAQQQAQQLYYDPFWGYARPGWGGFNGPFLGPIGPAGLWCGRRLGWGGGFGYPLGW